MRYLGFIIRNYRAIKGPLKVNLKDKRLIPIVGINECRKTTILQAIYCFDYTNDKEYKGRHLQNIKNLYETVHEEGTIEAEISCTKQELDRIFDISLSPLLKNIDKFNYWLETLPFYMNVQKEGVVLSEY